MIVRPLFGADAPAWRAMMLDATAANPAAFLLSASEVGAMTDDQVRQNLEQGRLRGLFDDEARLLGFAGLHLWQMDRLRHRADIGPFYIDPTARGTGAADRLMTALVDIARAGGVVWLDLWVAASNGRAQAFYARHSFQQVARRQDAVRIDGRSEDDVLMTRRLAG
ncbi:N-acetyltransferase family protein [Jannaschia sp. 2305UL9-9]|uniref:GNAT family N-acetyltransferase n=1 Tax=Jannaschia sp. 2305UL9-9 TaxID=3121638 RepID=UPI00352889CE